MMEHYFAGDSAKAQAMLPQANAEAGIDEAVHNDPTALAPMPPAPKAEPTVVDSAITKLNSIGGEHAALVQRWGSDAGENLAYAFEAFKDIAANRPDLIAKFDQSGLGDDPSVIEFLAKHQRLQAGMMGDFVTRNNAPSIEQPRQAAIPRGQSAPRAELDRIYEETPPGSPGYKKASVQRIRQLNEAIHGDGPAVGRGGRTG
jgi:hypothetical protein